jgi:FlaA1/EpsC-like NDP-sugar epimerase
MKKVLIIGASGSLGSVVNRRNCKTEGCGTHPFCKK